LHLPLDEVGVNEIRPQKTKSVPVVLSKDEAKAVIRKLVGVPNTFANYEDEAGIGAV
jgi:hypothetical protein